MHCTQRTSLLQTSRAGAVPDLGDEGERAEGRLGQIVVLAIDEPQRDARIQSASRETHRVHHVGDGHLVALAEARVLVEPGAEQAVRRRRAEVRHVEGALQRWAAGLGSWADGRLGQAAGMRFYGAARGGWEAQ